MFGLCRFMERVLNLEFMVILELTHVLVILEMNTIYSTMRKHMLIGQSIISKWTVATPI